MAIHTHYKQPGETYPISIDFADQLPTGTALASAVVTATNEAGEDASADVLDGADSIDGTEVVQTITGGTHGQDYRLKFLATLDSGAILEEDLTLFVRDK